MHVQPQGSQGKEIRKVLTVKYMKYNYIKLFYCDYMDMVLFYTIFSLMLDQPVALMLHRYDDNTIMLILIEAIH